MSEDEKKPGPPLALAPGNGRDAKGRSLPGYRIPGAGRPKGFKGLAAMIREETQDGYALVRYAFDVWTGLDPITKAPVYSHADRWAAFIWLSDRGFGKPVQAIDLQTSDASANPNRFDPSRLDGKSLAELQAILERALDQEPTPVLDVAGIEQRRLDGDK